MKQILMIVLVALTMTATAATPPNINDKVLKAFKETFTNAKDVVWHEIENYYQAHFKQAEIITRASYDKEGNLISTVRYYGEETLPAHVRAKLKKRYAGKTVFGVTEITNNDEISYHIKLVDDKNWYTVKSDAWGWLELKEKYRKA